MFTVVIPVTVRPSFCATGIQCPDSNVMTSWQCGCEVSGGTTRIKTPLADVWQCCHTLVVSYEIAVCVESCSLLEVCGGCVAGDFEVVSVSCVTLLHRLERLFFVLAVPLRSDSHVSAVRISAETPTNACQFCFDSTSFANYDVEHLLCRVFRSRVRLFCVFPIVRARAMCHVSLHQAGNRVWHVVRQGIWCALSVCAEARTAEASLPDSRSDSSLLFRFPFLRR